ncbi:TPA: hypothetical protein GRI87_00800 [Vibrio parahaemolyticus]|nr:hypothetical protein [Vibrio parahaemolyticus]
MNILKTRATVLNRYTATVEWYTGRNRNGLLSVEIPFGHRPDDTGLLAELLAIQHLLFNVNVFTMQVVQPEPITLEVSDKRILGLVNCIPKAPLSLTSSFLRNRLKGVDLKLNIEQECFDQIEASQSEVYVAIEPAEPHFSHIVVNTPSLDEVFINTHAINKYVRLHTGGSLRKPIKSLISRLHNPKLVKMDIPQHVLSHKLIQYQNNENIEVWGIPDATLRFLIIKERQGKCLRTVFRRSAR